MSDENLISHTPTEFALKNKIVNEDTVALAKEELGKCYEEIIALFKEYMDMPEHQIKIIAIWIIGSYFHNEFSTYPFIFINAMRGSGKTRLLKIISNLVHRGNGDVLNNLSESVVFRTAASNPLILDELESIGSKEKNILRELLNQAYKKGGKVKRMKKVSQRNISGQIEEKQIVEEFALYTPIAMANIWGIDEVLGDRCITTILEKSNNPKFTKKIEDFDVNPKFLQIKRTLEKVSVVSVVSLRQKRYIGAWNDYVDSYYNTDTLYTYTTLTTLTTQQNNKEDEEMFCKIFNSKIEGRNFEIVFPLLLISHLLSEEIFIEMLKIFEIEIISKKEDEFTESRDVTFIDFISKIPIDMAGGFISLRELTERFKAFYGESDEDERWINSKWVGRAIKRLNLSKERRRIAKGQEVILNILKAQEKIKIFKNNEPNNN